jgi:ABC-2 type transport system permease protein
MKRIHAIIRKELKIYFNTPLGYVLLVAFLIVSASLFMQNYFLVGQASMRGYFDLLPWMFLFLIPAVTMRLWSEEKKQGTSEILFTLPLKNSEIVLGKFLSSMVFIIVALALTLPLAVVVMYTGAGDFGSIFTSYVGSVLLAATYLSMGLWISGLTSNQIIAFIGTTLLAFVFTIIGSEFVSINLPAPLVALAKYIDVSVHFQSIARGVMDSRDIIYYLSIITLFLTLNLFSISRKK